MLLSLLLSAWGVRWGLPNVHSWAPDEILPAQVLEGMERGFSGGWWNKYPPLHFYVLASLYLPILAVSAEPATLTDVSASYERLFVASRLVSVAMGGGVVVLVFLCGRRLVDRTTGLVAAVVVALSPTFVFYSKFANLDVPYLFWFLLALLAYLEALRSQALGAWLGFAAAATAAVTTKDQAYGLFVLPGLHLLWALARSRTETSSLARLGAALRDARVGLALGLAALVFTIAHNLAFNLDGFRSHVENISGPSAEGYRMFEPDLAGQAQLAALTGRLVVFVMGAPAALLALLGLLLALRRPRPGPLLATLLPPLSYHVLFQGLVLYSYDRFVLPMAVVLALFAGSGVSRLAARFGRASVWPLLALVIAFGLARSVSLDLALRHDGRYAAEAWLQQQVTPGDRVAALGPLEYLPRLTGLVWKQRSELERAVVRMDPAYVVVNADYARQAEYPQARELYARLDSGALGYERVYAARGEAPWPFRIDDWLRARATAIPSNLDKVNPEIRIYRRRLK